MIYDLTIINTKIYDILEQNFPTKQQIKYCFKILDDKYNEKPKNIFNEIVLNFVIVSALSNDWNYITKFPSFLIFDLFINSYHENETINITNYNDFVKDDLNNDMFRNIILQNASSIKIEFDGIDRIYAYVNDIIVKPIIGEKYFVVNSDHFKLQIPSNIQKFDIKISIHKLKQNIRKKTFVNNFKQFALNVRFISKNWNKKFDELLLKNLNSTLKYNNKLKNIPKQILDERIYLIQRLDNNIDNLLKCVDLTEKLPLSNCLLSAKAAVKTQRKISMFREKVLSELDEGPRLNLKFNRSKAALYMAHPERQDAEPLIEQLMKQVPKRAFKTLKRDSVPWHVELIGEGATDAGGPARDIFSQMCIEVMNPITGLFIETPNRRNNIGENQEVLIPNSYAISEEMQQRFVYVGLLMTIAFISRLQQPFKLAEFVWAYLTGEPLTIEDIYAVDNAFERLMKEIDNNEINDEEAKRRGLTFTAIDSHGAEVDLFPGGSSVKVTQEKLTEYSQLYKKYRLDEMKLQLDRLKEGIRYFFPEEATSLLSPWELELLVCGDMKVSVDDLKKHCKYDAKDHSTQMLWEVLEGFSPEERMLFIKFATGRMGLPPPGMKWHSELSIVWVQAHAIDDQQMPLPTAATCSSSIRIPRYSTKEWMARKIRAAILFGTEIDTDRQVDFSQIAPLS